MGRQAKGVRLIRLDEGQKLASVVAFEEEEHEGGSGSGNGEGHISGAVKLKTEQSISDILQFDDVQAAAANDEFEAFTEHLEPEAESLVAKEELQLEVLREPQDEGSMLEEF